MSIDSVLSGIGEMIGDLGFSFKSVADKAKTGAAMTPQGQAVTAASSAMSRGGSGKPSTNVIPTSGGSSTVSNITNKAKGMMGTLTSKKVFGIPILYIAAPVGIIMVVGGSKKFRRRK
jgi:hypothetical protein